jgi:hypothetical protein
MSEQKYYVGLKSLLDEDIITDFLWEDHRFYPCFEKSSYAITKSELAKIQNGALYHEFCKEFLSDSPFKTTREWINPMIELIPIMGVLY